MKARAIDGSTYAGNDVAQVLELDYAGWQKWADARASRVSQHSRFNYVARVDWIKSWNAYRIAYVIQN